jgi:hypothetical protein
MDMTGIAVAVRNALKQYREPDYIYDRVMLTSHLMLANHSSLPLRTTS